MIDIDAKVFLPYSSVDLDKCAIAHVVKPSLEERVLLLEKRLEALEEKPRKRRKKEINKS